MKTGTPPRVDGRSLHWDRMTEQEGDAVAGKFSYTDTPKLTKQRPCYITYTNKNVHEVLKTGFEQSPMFTGRIKGLGPRYCPSIEDKINRFADKEQHQIFVEPEGWDTCEIYVNGFSTSLPQDVQQKALRQIVGFEDVKLFRPGYAIEYDFFPPTQLSATLETHLVKNLFFAGQINGTTGYEEAGCQGLMAGINAHLAVNEKDPFVLRRDEAYIGVLIDDLVNKGTDEPYRMFTSRAEYRILLRQDNADARLTPLAEKLGIEVTERMNRVAEKQAAEAKIREFFTKTNVSQDAINGYLTQQNSASISQSTRLNAILSRPNISMEGIANAVPFVNQFLSQFDTESIETSEISIKYEGYIAKEREIADKMHRLEYLNLKPDFDYRSIVSLSYEAREKLSKQKPMTIGQASRISGISPSDISVLLVYMGR